MFIIKLNDMKTIALTLKINHSEHNIHEFKLNENNS